MGRLLEAFARGAFASLPVLDYVSGSTVCNGRCRHQAAFLPRAKTNLVRALWFDTVASNTNDTLGLRLFILWLGLNNLQGAENAASERTTVGELVRTILQPYHDDISRDRISASGPDVVVGATAVTSLALALHESATNAVKYGALSEPNGTIRINWRTQGDDFHLEWEENGGPAIVVPPKAEGFGSVLTERSVANQLRGKIDHDWQRNGLKLTLTIPLDRLSV